MIGNHFSGIFKSFAGKKSKRPVPQGFHLNTTVVPPIAADTIEFLEKDGVNVEGIFRLSGNQDDIHKVTALYETGKPVILRKMISGDPHAAAGILKLWLRKLPEGLLTFELHESFLVAIEITNKDVKLRSVKEVLALLPKINFQILTNLFRLLRKIVDNSQVTLMSAQNLAIVFAPTLCRSRDDSVSILMRDAGSANKLIISFINEYETLFIKPLEPRSAATDKQTERFQKTLKQGTIKMARKFLQEESSRPVVEASSSSSGGGGDDMTEEDMMIMQEIMSRWKLNGESLEVIPLETSPPTSPPQTFSPTSSCSSYSSLPLTSPVNSSLSPDFDSVLNNNNNSDISSIINEPEPEPEPEPVGLSPSSPSTGASSLTCVVDEPIITPVQSSPRMSLPLATTSTFSSSTTTLIVEPPREPLARRPSDASSGWSTTSPRKETKASSPRDYETGERLLNPPTFTVISPRSLGVQNNRGRLGEHRPVSMAIIRPHRPKASHSVLNTTQTTGHLTKTTKTRSAASASVLGTPSSPHLPHDVTFASSDLRSNTISTSASEMQSTHLFSPPTPSNVTRSSSLPKFREMNKKKEEAVAFKQGVKLSIENMVDLLMDGNSSVVEAYLDTLTVDERRRVVGLLEKSIPHT